MGTQSKILQDIEAREIEQDYDDVHPDAFEDWQEAMEIAERAGEFDHG